MLYLLRKELNILSIHTHMHVLKEVNRIASIHTKMLIYLSVCKDPQQKIHRRNILPEFLTPPPTSVASVQNFE